MTLESEISIIEMASDEARQMYQDLCVKWWKWLLSIPAPLNPVNDSIGEHAKINQVNENLFFLVQTIESTDFTPNRTISIKNDDSIFMPILNWISIQDDPLLDDRDLISLAKERMDNVSGLIVYLNKKPLEQDFRKFRIQTPVFETFLPKENILGLKSGVTRMMSDGYWLYFRPLVKEFEISTYGSCSSGVTKISVSYVIKVI